MISLHRNMYGSKRWQVASINQQYANAYVGEHQMAQTRHNTNPPPQTRQPWTTDDNERAQHNNYNIKNMNTDRQTTETHTKKIATNTCICFAADRFHQSDITHVFHDTLACFAAKHIAGLVSGHNLETHLQPWRQCLLHSSYDEPKSECCGTCCVGVKKD